MNKLSIGVVLLSILLCTGTVMAGPVGNTVDPAILRQGLIWKDTKAAVMLGEESDFISDRKLKNTINDISLTFHGAKLGVAIKNTALIYGLAGMATASADSFFETNNKFFWGAGCTVVAFEKKITEEDFFRIGFDAKYRKTKLDINTLISGNNVYTGNNINSSWDYYEWQVAMATSLQLYSFVPYLGVKYSDVGGKAEYTINNQQQKFDNASEKNLGIFLGCSFDILKTASVTIEARFVDEQAYTLGGMIRF